MSRRALWAPERVDGRAAIADEVAGPAPSASPTAQPSASGKPLPGRSAVDAHVGLARLATLLTEAAGVVQELARNQLERARETRLLSDVGTKHTPARLLTARDVAERLAVSERTVHRLRRRGELPAGIELGGVIRWTPESIDALVASGGRA